MLIIIREKFQGQFLFPILRLPNAAYITRVAEIYFNSITAICLKTIGYLVGEMDLFSQLTILLILCPEHFGKSKFPGKSAYSNGDSFSTRRLCFGRLNPLAEIALV
jgi:hypothetical protein